LAVATKKIRAAGAKEVGMKNPIEKAPARPNQNQIDYPNLLPKRGIDSFISTFRQTGQKSSSRQNCRSGFSCVSF
jgi:hypothetical protein